MSRTLASLRQAARLLLACRGELLDRWVGAIRELTGEPDEAVRPHARAGLGALLEHLERGEVEAFLAAEEQAAARAARSGAPFEPLALAIRALNRACLPFLLQGLEDKGTLAEALLALDELADRRLEILVRAQQDESARLLVEAQEQAAQVRERARDLLRANEALRRSEARSQHRAEQVALLASVLQRVAGILDPERLLQETASTIQSRMNHPYVAVVVLDAPGGGLVGRWAGRHDIDRHTAGRAEGPPRGIIGRALRRAAPQVVSDVAADPEYLADVAVTRSELVVPLIDAGAAVGAIDFQSDQPAAFDLEDVAAGEAIAEFLVVALRNARLVSALRDSQT
jgi:hypothetical protein